MYLSTMPKQTEKLDREIARELDAWLAVQPMIVIVAVQSLVTTHIKCRAKADASCLH